MPKVTSIAITGAAGFIGSNIATRWLDDGIDPTRLVLVDEPAHFARNCAARFRDLPCSRLTPAEFPDWLEGAGRDRVERVFHMGASSSTEEFREDFLRAVNTDYTARLWDSCVRQGIAYVYASSGATYGDGSLGFSDDPESITRLQPLNPYGWSKQNFDLWALARAAEGHAPRAWAGLKFFNVYGPGEDHKGSQANVVFHATNQALERGAIRLFKSHRPDYRDGEQRRDFVSVTDCVEVSRAFADGGLRSGIYNVGTGEARTFIDLALGVFAALRREPLIEFVPTPERLRPGYQYYTRAELTNLRAAGFNRPFVRLEDGIRDYLAKEATWKGKL